MQNGIVLIDEIENGLYHTSQEILWDIIFESSKAFNVQIFATTHSAECIEAFSSSVSRLNSEDDMARLFRIEKKEDEFRVIRYNHKNISAALESGWEVR